MRSALRKLAEVHDGDFRLTANQNVVVGSIKPEKAYAVQRLLESHGMRIAGTQLPPEIITLGLMAARVSPSDPVLRWALRDEAPAVAGALHPGAINPAFAHDPEGAQRFGAQVAKDLHHKAGTGQVRLSGLRLSSIACVALPTCGLAMAESERYLPALITRIETEAVDPSGLRDTDIVIRSSGCPNGCSRPYVAEIALVGKAPGMYNVFLGGAHDGTRVAKMVLEGADEDEIVRVLGALLRLYRATRRPSKAAAGRGLALEAGNKEAAEGGASGYGVGGTEVPLASEGTDGLLRLRVPDAAKAGGPMLRRGQAQDFESFGDWVIRSGFVAPTIAGRDFHDLTGFQRVVPSVEEAEAVLRAALEAETKALGEGGAAVSGSAFDMSVAQSSGKQGVASSDRVTAAGRKLVVAAAGASGSASAGAVLDAAADGGVQETKEETV